MFILFVSIISFGYLYEVFITQPDISLVLYYSFSHSIANLDGLMISVGITGATVMPYALFIHSWLTKAKDESIEDKRELRKVVVFVFFGF